MRGGAVGGICGDELTTDAGAIVMKLPRRPFGLGRLLIDVVPKCDNSIVQERNLCLVTEVSSESNKRHNYQRRNAAKNCDGVK